MNTHETAKPVFKVLANTDKNGFGTCSGGGCPTVYEIDEDTVAIQGYIADDLFDSSFIPDGEKVVTIPKGLLRQLAENYAQI